MSDHLQELGPPIGRADFVSLNDLLGRCAMAGAVWELRPLALDLLASIYRMGANLYLQQDGSAVPPGIYRLCEAHGWSVPDTEGEPPARFQASQRVQVLTHLSSLWGSARFPAKSEPGKGKYMRLGSWVFSRRAVGVDRQVAAAIVAQVAITRAAAAAPAPAASTVAAPVPTPAPVLALVPSGARVTAAMAEAEAAAKPPQGFVKGGGWRLFRGVLLDQYEALRSAGHTYETALTALHKGWGYGKAADKNGGPLAKVLTAAREDRRAELKGPVSVVHRLAR